MPETVVDTGNSIYPANHGANNTALGTDEEQFLRKAVKGANFVAEGGDLTYGAGSLQVTLQALTSFIDGRQVFYIADGSFTFTLPPNETNYLMVDRQGRLFYRDTNNPTVDEELVLWKMVTDGTGVTAGTQDLRRLNQFTEVGLNDGEFVYLSSDRTKTFRYNPGSGRVELVGILQPTRILGLPDPTDLTEAVPMSFVLGQATKRAKLASLTNLTLSGTQTIDDGSAGVGDIVAAFGQTAAAENGLYVVAAGTWTRHSTLDTSAKAVPGFTVYIEQGTSFARTLWTLVTTAAITLGTTALSFEQRRDPLVTKTASFTAIRNTGYFGAHGSAATLLTMTLPANADWEIGDFAYLEGDANTGLHRITGQGTTVIHFLSSPSPSGGSWTSISPRSAILVKKVASNVVHVVWARGQWDSSDGSPVRQHMLDSTKPTRGTAPVVDNDYVTKGFMQAQSYYDLSLTGPKSYIGASLASTTRVLAVRNQNGYLAVLYMTAGTTHAIAYSTDSGLTWARTATFTVNPLGSGDAKVWDLYIASSTRWVVSGINSTHNGVFVETDDGGANWTVNTDGTAFSQGLGSQVVDDQTAYWIGKNATPAIIARKTTNGGTFASAGTVQATATANTSAANCAIFAASATAVYVAAFNSAETTLQSFATSDGGSNWGSAVTIQGSTGITNAGVAMAGFSSTTMCVFLHETTLNTQRIYKSSDSAASWTAKYTHDLATNEQQFGSGTASPIAYGVGNSGTSAFFQGALGATSTNKGNKMLASFDTGETWTAYFGTVGSASGKGISTAISRPAMGRGLAEDSSGRLWIGCAPSDGGGTGAVPSLIHVPKMLAVIV